MFLPYDLREWVPDGHIVHFILEAVEQIPTAHFQINHRGIGSEQYSPTMMLGLLIYCYATGRFGSRTIEAASYSTWRYATCAPIIIPITPRSVRSTRPTKRAQGRVRDGAATGAARQQQGNEGKKPRGPEPKPPSGTPEPKARYNFSAPQSSIMKAGKARTSSNPTTRKQPWTRRCSSSANA